MSTNKKETNNNDGSLFNPNEFIKNPFDDSLNDPFNNSLNDPFGNMFGSENTEQVNVAGGINNTAKVKKKPKPKPNNTTQANNTTQSEEFNPSEFSKNALDKNDSKTNVFNYDTNIFNNSNATKHADCDIDSGSIGAELKNKVKDSRKTSANLTEGELEKARIEEERKKQEEKDRIEKEKYEEQQKIKKLQQDLKDKRIKETKFKQKMQKAEKRRKRITNLAILVIIIMLFPEYKRDLFIQNMQNNIINDGEPIMKFRLSKKFENDSIDITFKYDRKYIDYTEYEEVNPHGLTFLSSYSSKNILKIQPDELENVYSLIGLFDGGDIAQNGWRDNEYNVFFDFNTSMKELNRLITESTNDEYILEDILTDNTDVSGRKLTLYGSENNSKLQSIYYVFRVAGIDETYMFLVECQNQYIDEINGYMDMVINSIKAK